MSTRGRPQFRSAQEGVEKTALRANPAVGEWLIADIGGTHARFERWTPDGGRVESARRTYNNDDFEDIGALVQGYRREVGSRATQALLAVASPIRPREGLRLTNREWSLDGETLRPAAGLTRLCFVNDLVAAASAIETLDDKEIESSPGSADAMAPKLVVGVGTGLGAAVVLTGPERVLASEAGHMTAAVGTTDAKLAREHAARLHGRVSWERLLSGAGLSLFDAVARGSNEIAAPEDVAARVKTGEPQALRALNAFANALGQFAGDLTLAVCAFGGVYFAGGVITGLGPALGPDSLREGFEGKGRFAAQLRDVPLHFVKANDMAGRGLNRLLAGAVDAPVMDV